MPYLRTKLKTTKDDNYGTDKTGMPLLTVEFPNGTVWNATTLDALTSSKIVLENFRVVPFESGTVRIRTTPCDPSSIRLEVGTPVTLPSGEPGVVLMVDDTAPMIERCTDGVVVLADAASLSYRTKISIDELGTSCVPYTMRTFHGAEYLVTNDLERAEEDTAYTSNGPGDDSELVEEREDSLERDDSGRRNDPEAERSQDDRIDDMRRLCTTVPFSIVYNRVEGAIRLTVDRRTVYKTRCRPAYALIDPIDGVLVYVTATLNEVDLSANIRTAWVNHVRNHHELGRKSSRRISILASI